MTEHEIHDESKDRSYFTMIPNIVDDLGLDPYSIRLYLHLKRILWETGQCTRTSETLGAECGMSKPVVNRCKATLAKHGLINIREKKTHHGGRPSHIITIADIWSRNILHCEQKDQGSQIAIENVPIVTSEPCKALTFTSQGSQITPIYNHEINNHEKHKKDTGLTASSAAKPKRKKPTADSKERKANPAWEMFVAFCRGLDAEPKSIPSGRHLKAAGWLHGAGYTPAEVEQCTRDLKKGWWADKTLTLDNVANDIAQWKRKGATPNNGEPKRQLTPIAGDTAPRGKYAGLRTIGMSDVPGCSVAGATPG